MAISPSIQKRMPVYDSAAPRIPVISTLTDLWRFRYLVGILISRDLKVRYKRSVLGFGWTMLNPLLTMLVLAVVFSSLFSNSTPYYLTYLLVGILLMNLFAQGSTAALSSIQGNGALIRKMYVPPVVYAAATVGSALVNLIFALVPCIALALFDGVRPSVGWVLVVIPIIETTALALGVGLIVASLMVFFHDTFEIYQVVINAYFYFTPIMYLTTLLPPPLARLELLNPMYLTLAQFRAAFEFGHLTTAQVGQVVTFPETLVAAAFAIATLVIGVVFFNRLEDKFMYYV